MNGTPAQEAIALLIDLAQRGEIDPWDVKVIEVIDRYLSELALGTERDSKTRDADLSQSGQAFLWASMLVLLKANTLENLDEPEESELTELDEEIVGVGDGRLPLHLERHLRRRAAAPPPKRRPVTLSELIEQLQQMAEQLDEAPVKSRSHHARPLSRQQAAKAIAHLAHDENLTEIAKRLEELLLPHWQKLSSGNDWLNFEQLLDWWTVLPMTSDQVDSLPSFERNGKTSGGQVSLVSHEAAIDTTEQTTHDRVGVFWALLLLSAQSKVELSQEEFYQDLKIRTLP